MNQQEFEDVLHKFRDETAHNLQFQPPIGLLMDSSYCKSISSAIHKPGMKWERMKAVDSIGNMLPNESGIYMFVWCPDISLQFDSPPRTEKLFWVLYIGKAGIEDGRTATIRNRYLSEYSKFVGRDASCLWDKHEVKTREQRLSRYLTLRPLDFWYLTMENPQDIMRFERKLIRLLAPPLNSQHGPKIRPSGKPQPAFD